ncbi:MAG: hypothetical protein WCZ17_09215 [Candidatus Kapaibacterium sp.]|nr:hypothetical protein [Candidatus Kapabacteria bacterium]
MSMRINTEGIKAGMELAEPILNCYGQTLLNSGVILNTKHIRILKTWNIYNVTVKTEDNEQHDTNLPSDEIIQICRNSLVKKIDWIPELSIEEDLFNTAVLNNALNYGENE